MIDTVLTPHVHKVPFCISGGNSVLTFEEKVTRLSDIAFIQQLNKQNLNMNQLTFAHNFDNCVFLLLQGK